MKVNKLFQRLKVTSIARTLYFVIGIMATLICVELFALYFSLSTLSSVRAYVGGEGLWSKAQKDAVFHLFRYGVSRDEEDYLLFQEYMKVPEGDGKARHEFYKSKPDMVLARQGFLEGRNHPDDVDGMIELFSRFSNIVYIEKAIDIWGKAEPIALQMKQIAEELHKEIHSSSPSQEKINAILDSIGPINRKLTALEDEFSYTLGEGSRWLEHTVLRILLMVVITVEATGLLLGLSVVRRIQKGLDEVIVAADAFAKGVYSARANVTSHDEIRALADSFNLMSAKLERSISDRTRAERALRRAYDQLQLRVGELAESNQQLRREVAERERAEAELRRAFALLDQHVDNTPLGVVEWEQDHAAGQPPRVRRWSGRAQTIFGWTEGEVRGRSAEELGLVHEDDTERAAAAGRDLAEGRRPHNSLSLRCYTKGRRIRHCQWYNSALHPEDDGKVAVLSLVEDITEQVVALEDIHRLAHHDTLTGLPNRVLLQDRLGQALARVRREGDGVAVMLVDLDDFKGVNDTLGHVAGDRLLRLVAGRLGGAVRASDTLARLGGDEFAIAQPGLRAPESAAVLARKLLAALAAPFVLGGHELHVAASIGVALFPGDGRDADGLLKAADLALYRAKQEGRGRFRFFEAAMDAEARRRRRVERELRQALGRGELTLVYQPQLDLATGRIEGVEALARWDHPERGPVPPGEFVPVAEASGLIMPLGAWVLREACRQAAAWRREGLALTMAVNVSPAQLRHPDGLEAVGEALRASGLEPGVLGLEITEGVLMETFGRAADEVLRGLAARGVGLAIDDFGTGYSSLAYLRRLPARRIKVDRSFVRGIGADPEDEAVVRAIVTLGHALGKAVVAEGVETEVQLAFLRELGCDAAQGFLLARPQPAVEVRQLLAT